MVYLWTPLNLRVTPLEQTSIKAGPSRKGIGQRARRKAPRRRLKSSRRSSRSLFRRLSGKKAAADFKTLSRSVSSSEGLLAIAPGVSSMGECSSGIGSSGISSLASSLGGGPTGANTAPVGPPCPSAVLSSSRPSSLHGLGHKLAMALKSPRIRKQSSTMPLSPLARTEQPKDGGGPGGGPRAGSRSPSPVPTTYTTAHGASSRKTITKPRKSDAGCDADSMRLAVAAAAAAKQAAGPTNQNNGTGV